MRSRESLGGCGARGQTRPEQHRLGRLRSDRAPTPLPLVPPRREGRHERRCRATPARRTASPAPPRSLRLREDRARSSNARPTAIYRLKKVDPNNRILDVRWNPNPARPHPGKMFNDGTETVTVHILPVHSNQRAAAARALRSSALPALIDWLRYAMTAPEGWRLLRQAAEWTWAEDPEPLD